MAKRVEKGTDRGDTEGWEGEGWRDFRLTVGWGLFLGSWGSVESAGVRFAVLGISIRTRTPKHHKLGKRLDERERWRDLQCGSRCFAATVAPWGVKTQHKGQGRGVGEWDSKEEGESLGVSWGVGGVHVMTWKSQPVGHAGLCGALRGRKASESSLAASYLALDSKEWTCHWLHCL